MPTKKQRRRMQKARRHDYEYVYVDEEGNEVAVDPAELRAEKDGKRPEPRAPRNGGRRTATRGSARRTIEPASWRRAARRALIFGPVIVVAMMLLNPKHPLAQLAPGIFLIAFFIPFSYFTDSLAYRMYRKRLDSRAAKNR